MADDRMRQACISCGQEDIREFLPPSIGDYEYGTDTAGHYGFLKCGNCGMLSLHPLPGQELLFSYYPPDYATIGQQKKASRILVELYYKLVAAQYRSLVGGHARILDIGCSSGHAMEFLMKQEPGWDITGVEMSAEAVAVGRANGLKIVHGAFEDIHLPESEYDLVIMQHLIEHVLDPVALVRKAHSVLKPGGVLYIETPNVDAPDFSLFGKYWGGLHYPRHTFLFNKTAMASLLHGNGFKVSRILGTLNLFGWALSVQNLMVALLGLKTRGGRIAIHPLLMLGFAPVVLLQSAIGNAAGMRVISIKG